MRVPWRLRLPAWKSLHRLRVRTLALMVLGMVLSTLPWCLRRNTPKSLFVTFRLRPGSPTSRRLRAAAAAASSEASSDDVAAWSARELRKFLDERGVRHADCFEKRELVDRARVALARPPPAAEPRAAAPAPPPAAPPQTFEEFGELVTVPGSERERASFLFLHGFGDSARGFVGQLPKLLGMPWVRYLLPTAPAQGGMRSWFSFGGGGAGPGSGAAGQSVEYAHHLIRSELARGVSGDRIFVGGFSQGGSVAVKAALSFPDAALGGCVAASTFLGMGGGQFAQGSSELTVAPANGRTPVLCVHGEADQVVPMSSGQNLVAAVRAKGVPAELRTYPGMGHAYCPEEAADVARFVKRRVLLAGGGQGLQELSARQLKALLVELGASTTGCFEKGDLLERARQVLA